MSPKEKLRYDCDIKAVNILLLGLPGDIYTLINHYQTVKEIWDRVKELMEGRELALQEFNTKFVNHLQPEWSRFVTAAKQAKDLHEVNFDQLYDFLKHNEKDAKEVQEMQQRFPDPLALVANTYNPPPSYNSQRSQQSQGYAVNAGKSQAMGTRAINTIGEADHVDAYDSDCDDKAITSAIFMASLSPAGSLNGDTVAPTYDLDILFKVPHYDTYHENDVPNSVVQEMEYIEHFVSNNDSLLILTLTTMLFLLSDYMDFYLKNGCCSICSPLAQDNAMILSVIEQMKSQVEKCNRVNQETKSVNESLTSELERCKEKLKVLEAKHNSKEFLTKREEFLDSEMQAIFVDHNKNGKALVEKHDSIFVCDSEETLILAKESQLKMKGKQKEHNDKSIDYSKMNKLYEYFVPQKQLSIEQVYWSPVSKLSLPENVTKPIPTQIFPEKLPSTNKVHANLQTTRDLIDKFDACIKKRTVLSGVEVGNWGVMHI
ncbi:hypothetical protein Tco_0246664 [Tanacetum coccineum]